MSLIGTGETPSSKLFLGSFGPRGLASIVLSEDLPGGVFLAMVVTYTVGLSLIVHGVSANPLAGWITRRESAAHRAGNHPSTPDRGNDHD